MRAFGIVMVVLQLILSIPFFLLLLIPPFFIIWLVAMIVWIVMIVAGGIKTVKVVQQ